MEIKVLVENYANDENLGSQHGLSLHIKTANNQILFDMGQDDLLVKNARAMNINLDKVDMAFVSHGHFDHGSGLWYFMNENFKAPIYVQKGFFGNYVLRKSDSDMNIGIAGSVPSERIIELNGSKKLSENIVLLSNPQGRGFLPNNEGLLVLKNGEWVDDDFNHEHNLVISENGKNVLIHGCAHRGVVNILNQAIDEFGKIDVCVGGFHLMNTHAEAYLKELAAELNKHKTKFYTCHCTGLPQFEILKSIMGNKIDYIRAGDLLNIE